MLVGRCRARHVGVVLEFVHLARVSVGGEPKGAVRFDFGQGHRAGAEAAVGGSRHQHGHAELVKQLAEFGVGGRGHRQTSEG